MREVTKRKFNNMILNEGMPIDMVSTSPQQSNAFVRDSYIIYILDYDVEFMMTLYSNLGLNRIKTVYIEIDSVETFLWGDRNATIYNTPTLFIMYRSTAEYMSEHLTKYGDIVIIEDHI